MYLKRLHKIGLLWLLTFVAFLHKSKAQTDTCQFSVEGTVLDIETKEPMAHVTVRVKGTEKFVVTNQLGTFLITGLCQSKNTLILSCSGFSDSFKTPHHEHNSSPHVYLTRVVSDMGLVTIQVSKSTTKGTETLSKTNISSKDIQSNPGKSLADLLKDKPGLSVLSIGTNVQLPVIHGLYGNRILILNNGLKHGFQNWGLDHAPEIDITAANTIEVYKGAAGVAFGPEALGGAISINPNPMLLNKPFYLRIGSGFETNGKGITTTVESGKGYKNLSYFVGGKYQKIGDRHAPRYSLTNTGKEEKSVQGGVHYHTNAVDISTYYSYVYQNLALLRSSVAESGYAFIRAINADKPIYIRPFSYTLHEPNQIIQHHLAKTEMDWWYNGHRRITLRLGQQLNKRKEFDVRRNAAKPIIDLDLYTTDIQVEWKHTDQLNRDGLIGLQAFTQNNDNNPGTGTTPFIPNYNTYRYSAFAVESLKKNRSALEAGIRVDYALNNVRGRESNQNLFADEFYFMNLTSSMGIMQQISKKSTFKSNLGTAWRTPNLAELYSFGQHGFKTTFGLLRYYTNPNGELRTDKVSLMSQSSVKPENGFKFINEFANRGSKKELTLTAYSHYIQNYIFQRPVAVIGTIRGPMPVFIVDQANAFFAGADVSWEQKWSRNINGTYNASYVWSRNVTKNEPLINQPPLRTSYSLVFKKDKFWHFRFSEFTIKPSYTFRQFNAPRTITPEELINGTVNVNPQSKIFDFMDAPKGYFLLDLSYAFKWHAFKINLTAQNILNTSYRDYLNEMRYFADEPGFNMKINLSYTFNKATKNNHKEHTKSEIQH